MAIAKIAKKIQPTELEIVGICENAKRQIYRIIERHAEKYSGAAFVGKRLVELEEAVKAAYEAMGVNIGNTFANALPPIMQQFYRNAARDTGGSAIIGVADKRRIKDALKNTFEQVAMRTQQMSFDHIRKLRNFSADIIRTATLTGASRKTVTAQLLAEANKIPGFEFIANNGAHWKSEAYFAMLARTELLSSARRAYDDKCAEDGYDVVMLSTSGNSCEKCAEWEGKIFSLTGATKGIPSKADLEADGVFHPNCTHTYSALTDYELEEMGLKIRQPGAKE